MDKTLQNEVIDALRTTRRRFLAHAGNKGVMSPHNGFQIAAFDHAPPAENDTADTKQDRFVSI